MVFTILLASALHVSDPVAMAVGGLLIGNAGVDLALSLPESPIRTAILAATYIVVLFAVIVQGGTISGLIRRIKARTT